MKKPAFKAGWFQIMFLIFKNAHKTCPVGHHVVDYFVRSLLKT